MSANFILNMSDITKRFPGVLALDHVSLRVKKGEVHALLGENGAGKSTLMKILAGAYVKDEGEIEVFSKKTELGNPKAAENLGISIIYQELNLIPTLTVAENIFLGRYKMRGSIQVNWKEVYAAAEELLQELGVDVKATDYIRDLGIAQQQMVEVAKALSMKAKIIIMDEPSAPLTERETKNLFRIVKQLKESGVSIIYISHRLEEVLEICDRATVMRDGTTIKEIEIANVTMDEIIRLMVGRELKDKYPRIEKEIGKELFRVENLCAGSKVQNINFSVREGEVLCVGGLVGAGRTETVRAVFGLDAKTSGKIFIDGKECEIRNPKDAIRAGIGFVTEDRKGEGLILKLGVGENVTLAALDSFRSGIHLNLGKEKNTVSEYVSRLNIKTPSIFQKVENLSGGNQQKVVLAKWLLSKCRVLILDEPTRGIDVGAKIEVYNLINELAKEGKAILVITSEIPELLGICDRVVVMARGRVSGTLTREEANQEAIMTLAVGAEERGNQK
ncbi:sugar ABC transporter ATP-binding protein [Muricomes sp. OA1]|uniref:Sugar ABC transporter ATP-binding protein n=1 Tax=Hungatella hathewayi TaxID=154046 RepID=A0A3E2X0D7_9FIRM|nr:MULTISPECIES: sugar ABC transporter ATP-binding protein [Clostridia]MCH1973848.1 sugar ABC transporter ATP-binding protein [Muricomes sp. OA1]MRM87596.1 sugar ABC transporter ATP-binding protein [Faecalicatena contorta]RGC34552.1 sugar ABC transporter ATP-binding protein [Hungatella hathewayi]GKH32614.1 ribose import ATP-binding protein RbsA [Faecalicatena contorta]